MDTRIQSQLASVLMLAVGLWLLLTPLFITMSGGALVNILVVGAIVALAGLVELFWRNTLPSWLSALAAVWLFVSLLFFDMSAAAAWNIAVSALVTFVLSVWDGAEISQLQDSRRLQT